MFSFSLISWNAMAVIMASPMLFYEAVESLGMHFETRNSRGQHAKSSGWLSSIFLASQF